MLHVMIGRNKQSDFRLENGSVSRVHAVLKTQGEVLRLEDKGSRNGTYIMRGKVWQRIETAVITKDDQLRFGEEEVAAEKLLKSVIKRPKIGAKKQAGDRPKIGRNAAQTGAGSGEKPLKKFMKPRRNKITGDIEEGG